MRYLILFTGFLLCSCTMPYGPLDLARKSSDVHLCRNINLYGGSIYERQAASERGVNCDSYNMLKLKAKKPEWVYYSNQDKLTDKQEYFARIGSKDEYFPEYGQMPRRGELLLQTLANGKKGLFLTFTGSIFDCSAIYGCKLKVRFDDAPVITYSARVPSDHSSDYLSIADYSGFVGRIMKAKRVRIEANFYQAGSRVFEFDVQGFDADRYLGKK